MLSMAALAPAALCRYQRAVLAEAQHTPSLALLRAPKCSRVHQYLRTLAVAAVGVGVVVVAMVLPWMPVLALETRALVVARRAVAVMTAAAMPPPWMLILALAMVACTLALATVA
jgi:hypothetical protein